MSMTGGPGNAVQILIVGAVGIAICYIAATRTLRVSATGLAVVGAGLLIPGPGGLDLAQLRGGVAVVTVIAWLIGHSIRQAQAQAELLRAQAAAQTVMAERLRIARELHDIVAHSIGIIAIQAGAGRRIFDARPAEARDALADIERLAAMTLDAGVTVDVEWRGSREPLPADIDLSAFRIIQEAVTNVVRHAGTGECQVLIDQQDGQLSIEVTDSGRRGSVAGTGYGITGMRERAALLGGDFSAGPRPGGGFRVAARLPVPVRAR